MATVLTREQLIEIWRRLVDSGYARLIENDNEGSYALIRGFVEPLYELGLAVQKSQQAVFYLPHGDQSDVSATSDARATMEVTLSRSASQNRPLIAGINAIKVRVLGRTYRNSERAIWYPFDDEPVKTLRFSAEVPGFAGNVPYPNDENGDLLLDRISFFSLARGRTNINASVIDPTKIQGTGRPDTFEPDDVGSYLKVINAANPENVGKVFLVKGFESLGVENPTNSGLYPKSVTVEITDFAQIYSAKSDDGGVFTDETLAARSSVEDDLTLMQAAPVVDDAYYFGRDLGVFSGVNLEISTLGSGEYEIEWEYFNGIDFVPFVEVDDETVGFRISGKSTWTLPGDWVATTVDGVTAFWARARVAVFTSLDIQPLGKRLHLLVMDPLLLEDGNLHWSILEWDDSETALEIVKATLPAGGRDDDLYILGDERGVYQQEGESDMVFRDRASRLAEVVSPKAIRSVINRALVPISKRGVAVDVYPNEEVAETEEGQAVTSNGAVTGMFLDVNFLDNYTGTYLPLKSGAGVLVGASAEARVVATGDVPLVIGLPGVIDGVVVQENEPVLLVGQASASENGLYVFFALAVPQRVSLWGFPTGQLGTNAGKFITAVTDGAAFANTRWICTNEPPSDIIDVNGLDIVQLTETNEFFPDDPWIQLLSFSEAYYHFFVFVPHIILSDYGMAFEDGPVQYIDEINGYLGPAFQGLLDGSIVTASGLYSAIYNSVDAIRAGGVGFTMILSEEL